MADDEARVPDSILQALVGVTNNQTEPEEGTAMILTLAGSSVSGRVIPNWQWAQQMGAQLVESYRRAGGDPTNEAPGWAELMQIAQRAMEKGRDRRLTENDVNAGEQGKEADSEPDPPTPFIHLRDARIFIPGQEGMPGNGMLWRGRLSEIVGWSFGQYAPARPEHDL